MATLGRAVLETAVDQSGLQAGLKQSEQQSTSSFTNMANVARGVLSAGLAVATAAVGVLTAAVIFSVGEAGAAQQAQAQLGAVLTSTGMAAGVTSQMANELAGGWQEVTRFSDEAVVGAESVLLTFTKIGQDVFPDALESVLDMSTALGQDLQTSSIQVGKALNDPIAGITALKKVGVSLTDQQKDMIRSFVAVGDVASAQGVILQELQTEFGGSAVAAGKTFAGQMDIARNAISDVAEEVGFALMPILQDFASEALPVLIDALQVMSTVHLPAFVEMVGKMATGLLSAFNAGMTLITWSAQIDLALQAQETRLLGTGLSYEEYRLQMTLAAEAAGKFTLTQDEVNERMAQGGRAAGSVANAVIVYSDAEYTAIQSGMELEAQDLKLALAWASGSQAMTELNTDVANSVDINISAAAGTAILEAAVLGAASAYDAEKTAIGLVNEAINALSETEVDAERKRLVLTLATQNLTAAEQEEAIAALGTLEVLQQLNTDVEAGTAGNEEFYAVMLGGITTMEDYNEMMGNATNTISGTEQALIGATGAAGDVNSTFGQSTAVQEDFRDELEETEDALYEVADASGGLYSVAGGMDAIGSAAQTAAGKVGNLKDAVVALGANTPEEYIPSSPPPLAQGIYMVAEAAGTLGTAYEDLAAKSEMLSTGFLAGIESGLDEGSGQLDRLEGILDMAGKLSRIGGSFADLFETQTLDPMKAELAGLDEQIAAALDAGDMYAYTALMSERAELAREIAEQEERILLLQQKQQELDFLNAQLDLLKLAQEAGMDVSIFEGMLGGMADPAALADMMNQVIQALIDQANETLEAGSPSRVFERIGMTIPEGLEGAVRDGATDVMDATRHVLESAIEEASDIADSTRFPQVGEQVAGIVAATPPVPVNGTTQQPVNEFNFDFRGAQGVDEQAVEQAVLKVFRQKGIEADKLRRAR